MINSSLINGSAFNEAAFTTAYTTAVLAGAGSFLPPVSWHFHAAHASASPFAEFYASSFAYRFGTAAIEATSVFGSGAPTLRQFGYVVCTTHAALNLPYGVWLKAFANANLSAVAGITLAPIINAHAFDAVTVIRPPETRNFLRPPRTYGSYRRAT